MLSAEILACNKSALCRSASPPFSFVLAYRRFYLPTKKFHPIHVACLQMCAIFLVAQRKRFISTFNKPEQRT